MEPLFWGSLYLLGATFAVCAAIVVIAFTAIVVRGTWITRQRPPASPGPRRFGRRAVATEAGPVYVRAEPKR